jgi:steroid 5-alpha reductase family enzyme
MNGNDLTFSIITLAVGLVTVAVVMGVCLQIAIRKEKLTIVDTAWGLGFIAVAFVSLFVTAYGDGMPGPQAFLFFLVLVWGVRLALHINNRNAKAPEDRRYQELAEADGRSFTEVALRRVFIPQGVAMWLVATPVMVGMNNLDTGTVQAWLGLAVWAVGMFFETVGDFQLAAFKNNPENEGKLMDQGLWKYTRHPNYFGDACVWWGIWIVAASSWAGLATVVGPIAMTVFLTRVTGVPLNEKGMSQSKPGYDEYVRRTSAFIPRPPRPAASSEQPTPDEGQA